MENRFKGVNALLFVLYFGVCECTLTTAVIKDDTSPKPVYRRLNIGRSGVDEIHTDEMFDALDGRRRNSKTRSQIWDWDTWCLLQPRTGSCGQSIHRFYYNRQLEKCLPFVYSGCNANENNFETKLDCELRCTGVTSTMNSHGVDQGLFCQYQPDVGACLAFDTKYYFDINQNTCSKFVYGGCAGNTNRFETKFHCMATCKRELF
ncbi:boophilin-G2-like [Pieris brassicae]|uniref:boophilin-G2-like n=1 Tax=Pieris brassicae TaxID=7116 RepID=UPI001E6607FA|nr:boophilin-G2-like [Pieris brassicae]